MIIDLSLLSSDTQSLLIMPSWLLNLQRPKFQINNWSLHPGWRICFTLSRTTIFFLHNFMCKMYSTFLEYILYSLSSKWITVINMIPKNWRVMSSSVVGICILYKTLLELTILSPLTSPCVNIHSFQQVYFTDHILFMQRKIQRTELTQSYPHTPSMCFPEDGSFYS